MNYRHAFHAGNFADLVKHAIVAAILRELTTGDPVTVIDTHAGAGLYDLAAEASRRTGEGEAGVGRLMADVGAPAAFDALKAAVGRINGDGAWRFYPGSPLLIAAALRPGDRYLAWEIRVDDCAALRRAAPWSSGVEVHQGDGWARAARVVPAAPAPTLVLIDPPYERGDDYVRAIALSRRVIGVNPRAVVAIWAPLKDLATFDAFLGGIEDAAPGRGILSAQARLRPLTNPMRLNGCAMVVVNPTPHLSENAQTVVDWISNALGEVGALGRVDEMVAGRG